MAAKVIQQFWSAVRGSFAGLVGRRTDGSEDGVTVAVGDDGDIHPFRLAGEDVTADRMKVMPKTTNGSGGILTASGTGHNAPCVVHRLIVAETGGANSITVLLRDGGAAGTIRTPTFTVPAGGSISHELNLAFGTDCYVTFGGAGTPSGTVTVHSG